MSAIFELVRGDGPLLISAPHAGTYLPDELGARLTPPGRALVDTDWFADRLYAPGDEPNDDEVRVRRALCFDPYHDALTGELRRTTAAHGYALLLDAHSIWGKLPLVFEGELPEINLGTNSGRSCDPQLISAAVGAVAASPFSHVLDGRFKGGYITRHYGAPRANVHALQIEINQRAYLADGSRTQWDDAKAARLQRVLRAVCEAMLALITA